MADAENNRSDTWQGIVLLNSVSHLIAATSGQFQMIFGAVW
jgi:hypothetical protein